MISTFLYYIIHVDKYISILIQNYGVWVYLILFIVIFCETGLVVTPFLPGDSLLFTVGAFSAKSIIDIKYAFLIFLFASVLGDTVNFHIGLYLGPKFNNGRHRFIKKEYVDKTYSFYERHGGKTIVIARFIPIIRSFAPFVAGLVKMRYIKFISFNVIGAFAWVSTILFAGYNFGNIPIIKNNFSLFIYLIILLSILPGIIGYLNNRRHVKK